MSPETLPLRDIHLPPSVGWWPPAPGWWLLALLLGLVAVAAAILRRRRRARSRPGPAGCARAELASLVADWERDGDARRLAADLSVLLRRLLLTEAPAAGTAGATGERWLARLDARAGAPLFTAGPGRVLIDAPYRPVADFDVPGLLAACKRAIDGPPGEPPA